MVKKQYCEAINFVALNDDPSDLDPVSVRKMISVSVVAFVYGVKEKEVAYDIVELRKNRHTRVPDPREN